MLFVLMYFMYIMYLLCLCTLYSYATCEWPEFYVNKDMFSSVLIRKIEIIACFNTFYTAVGSLLQALQNGAGFLLLN